MIRQNRLYQLLFDYSFGLKRSRLPKSRGVAFRVYKLIVDRHRRKGIHDQYVRFRQNGHELLLSTTHGLPFTLLREKLYSSNVARICKHVLRKYPGASVVDIGANIGDTAFFIKQEVNCPILCVEGNEQYEELLVRNVQPFADVEIETSFVGEDETMLGRIVLDGRGTAKIVKGTNGNTEGAQLRYKRLETIVTEHPKFKDFKVLKIDTDGYDCQIIRSSTKLLARQRPVVFFEYAPAWLPAGKESEVEIFELLARTGYSGVLFYTAPGELLLSCKLGESHIARQAHEYFRRGRRFGDVVAFPECDEDLHREIERAELVVMRSAYE